MKFFKPKIKRLIQQQEGFTLVELLIYTFVLVIMATTIVSLTIRFLGINETARRTREATNNARGSLETIAQEIRHAKSVYTPTSVFTTNPGQLSLETTRDLPADETSTFVDFYVDNGSLYLKREGQNPVLVTGQKVKVTNLVFTNLTGYSSGGAVRTQITVVYKDPTNGPPEAVSLESTTATRAY